MNELQKGYESITNEEKERLKSIKESLSPGELELLKNNSSVKSLLENEDIVSIMTKNDEFEEIKRKNGINNKLNVYDLVEIIELNI